MNDDSQSDSLQDPTGERSRILAIMRKNGLELREDGSGWVSIQDDENEIKRIDLPEDDEPIAKTSTVFCLIIALGLLLAASQAESLGICAASCLFRTLGCMIMLAGSEGKVGYTILKIMLILSIFWMVFMLAFDSLMGGGYGDFGLGGLSGWGGP